MFPKLHLRRFQILPSVSPLDDSLEGFSLMDALLLMRGCGDILYFFSLRPRLCWRRWSWYSGTFRTRMCSKTFTRPTSPSDYSEAEASVMRCVMKFCMYSNVYVSVSVHVWMLGWVFYTKPIFLHTKLFTDLCFYDPNNAQNSKTFFLRVAFFAVGDVVEQKYFTFLLAEIL